MTSIAAHKVLQALIMFATSDICPDAEWYGEELNASHTQILVIERGESRCAVPLAPGMKPRDAKVFYKAARRLAK